MDISENVLYFIHNKKYVRRTVKEIKDDGASLLFPSVDNDIGCVVYTAIIIIHMFLGLESRIIKYFDLLMQIY